MPARYVLGINGVYHESAACLLRDGRVVAFGEEERFVRRKHAKAAEVTTSGQLPAHAIRHCLEQAGIGGDELDAVGYSFDPALRGDLIDEPHQIGSWGSPEGEAEFLAGLSRVPAGLDQLLGTRLGDRFSWIGHETAHAASAYFASPYEEAAVLSMDGIGEGATTLAAYGRGCELEGIKAWYYPNSIGFLWEKLSQFVGLGEYDAPKLMAVASFGDPHRFENEFAKFLRWDQDGFEIDGDLMGFRSGNFDALEALFGPRRQAGEYINQRDADVAACLQASTEAVLLELAARLKEETGSGNLCLAGGVALNCVAMGRLAREAGLESIFVQPLAHDAGTALGAALTLWHQSGGTERYVMEDPYLGPAWGERDVREAIEDAGLEATRPDDLYGRVADAIAGGALVGWYQGAAEVGPRALGNRSIVADPRRAGTKERINLKVKHREYFRPFAPSVLAEHAYDWFVLGCDSISTRFMSFACPVRPERAAQVAAITHVDGTSRLQTVHADVNPRYHALIEAFADRTGIPLVVNTSFNTYDEPIVSSPSDAIRTFLRTGLDLLVLDDWVVERPERG